MVYDYLGRRVGKVVYNWSGSAWQVAASRKFIWGGWMLLMELDGRNSDAGVRTYAWGLDLAGLNGQVNSLESAGTIGGLLAVQQAQVGGGAGSGGLDGGDYVYTYDATGNVTQVIAWASDFGGADGYAWDADPPGQEPARLAAHYEYAPYGGVLSQAGFYADANPFRFSTKYWDDETGLGYWGYRYYSPTLGRWVSRDPIEEAGGFGLYVYVGNGVSNYIDPWGKAPSPPEKNSLSQKTCGEGWEPVAGDDGKVGVDEVTFTSWSEVGENNPFDQLFRFRHLIKYARAKYYWQKRHDVSEISDCGRHLDSTVTVTFSKYRTWQVGGTFQLTFFEYLDVGINGSRGGGESSGFSISLHFTEGAPCYEYKGYVFARRIEVQFGFMPPWQTPSGSRMQFGSVSESDDDMWTGEYKKLLCRRKCCE